MYMCICILVAPHTLLYSHICMYLYNIYSVRTTFRKKFSIQFRAGEAPTCYEGIIDFLGDVTLVIGVLWGERKLVLGKSWLHGCCGFDGICRRGF